ncbi:MAG: flippase [bacterium]|nr:flippase [bacterium]
MTVALATPPHRVAFNDMAHTEKHNVARNTVYIFVSNGFRILFNGLLFFIVARVLGVEELGRFQFALSYATLFTIFTHLGISDLIIREIATDRSKSGILLSKAFATKLIAGSVAFLATMAGVILTGKPGSVIELVLIAGISISLIASFDTVAYFVLIALEKMLAVLWLSALRYGLTLALGLAALLMGTGAKGVLIAMLAAQAVYMAAAYITLIVKYRIKFRGFPISELPGFVLSCLPFAVGGVFYIIFAQAGYTIVNYMEGDKATGEYTAAAKLINYLNFIPGTIYQAVYPALSRKYAIASEDVTAPTLKTLRYVSGFSIPVALFLFFRADAVILLAFGDEFLAAVPLLKIMSIALPFTFITVITESAVFSIHGEKYDAIVSGAMSLLFVGLNIVLIALMGILGAALAYTITLVIHSALRTGYLIVRLSGFNIFRELLALAPSVLVFGVAVYFTSSLHILIHAPLMFAGYGLLLLITRAVYLDDLVRILKR